MFVVHIWLSELAGLTASTISFPLEVARKRLMVGALQGKCLPHMMTALSEVGGGPPWDLPRVGRELPEGDAEFGHHVDVLRGVEGHPLGRQGQARVVNR